MSDPAAPVPPAPASGGRLGRWLAAGLVVASALAIGAMVGYRYGAAQPLPEGTVVLTQTQLAAHEQALTQRETELRFLRAQLDTADGEIAVERAARLELETQLRQAQADVGRGRDQLAFYEQLLPPGPAGSLDIRGAEFVREGAGLRYRVLMMRSGRSETPFQGELRFEAAGLLDGATVSVSLAPLQVAASENTTVPSVPVNGGAAIVSPAATVASGSEGAAAKPPADKAAAAAAADASAPLASAATGAAPSATVPALTGNGLSPEAAAAVAKASDGPFDLHFDQYQRSQGVLAVPPGFVPEAITVSVLENGTVRATRTVKLEF